MAHLQAHLRALAFLLLATAALLLLGTAVGSSGWSPWWGSEPVDAAMAEQILWAIRAPRSVGAWCAGALLALAGAIAQGLFRNPLADPYLLGSSSGAALGVALLLSAIGVSPAATSLALRLGLTGAAFIGAVAAVLLTLLLAQGVAQTMRLLLAGVVVGVVLGSCTALVMLMSPEILRAMQGFMLGTTGFLSWNSVGVLAAVLAVCLALALACSRALDALALGEHAAHSLGVRLVAVRVLLIGALALATGAAVAQTGLIAFVGLVAPHLVRQRWHPTHTGLLLLSTLAGGVLLLAADIAARWLLAPAELPVGVLTALLGGAYLLWLMHRKPVFGGEA